MNYVWSEMITLHVIGREWSCVWTLASDWARVITWSEMLTLQVLHGVSWEVMDSVWCLVSTLISRVTMLYQSGDYGYWTLIGQKQSCDLGTGLWLVERGQEAFDWSRVITWLGYWPLILVKSDHVTWVLASDWSRGVKWPGYWPLIGQSWESPCHNNQRIMDGLLWQETETNKTTTTLAGKPTQTSLPGARLSSPKWSWWSWPIYQLKWWW